MIFQASKDIEAAIKGQNWNCGVDERENSSAVIAGFNMKTGNQMQVFFISAADNDAAVRVFQFFQTPAGKQSEALRVCNRLNRDFRFAKFVLEDDGWVGIQMDMPTEAKPIGQVCLELLMRLLNIAEEAYPSLAALNAPAAGGNDAPNASGNSAGRF